MLITSNGIISIPALLIAVVVLLFVLSGSSCNFDIQRHECTKHQLRWTSLKKMREWRMVVLFLLDNEEARLNVFVNTAFLLRMDHYRWRRWWWPRKQTDSLTDWEADNFSKKSLLWSTDEWQRWWWWPGHSLILKSTQKRTSEHRRTNTFYTNRTPSPWNAILFAVGFWISWRWLDSLYKKKESRWYGGWR